MTLSSLGSVEWRQWHPSELCGAITLTGEGPGRPGEATRGLARLCLGASFALRYTATSSSGEFKKKKKKQEIAIITPEVQLLEFRLAPLSFLSWQTGILDDLLELCRNSGVCGIDGIPRGRPGLVSLVRCSWSNTPSPRLAACVSGLPAALSHLSFGFNFPSRRPSSPPHCPALPILRISEQPGHPEDKEESSERAGARCSTSQTSVWGPAVPRRAAVRQCSQLSQLREL